MIHDGVDECGGGGGGGCDGGGDGGCSGKCGGGGDVGGGGGDGDGGCGDKCGGGGGVSPLLHQDGESCIKFTPDGKIHMVRQGPPRNNITIVNMIRSSPSPIPIDGIRCVGNPLG